MRSRIMNAAAATRAHPLRRRAGKVKGSVWRGLARVAVTWAYVKLCIRGESKSWVDFRDGGDALNY